MGDEGPDNSDLSTHGRLLLGRLYAGGGGGFGRRSQILTEWFGGHFFKIFNDDQLLVKAAKVPRRRPRPTLPPLSLPPPQPTTRFARALPKIPCYHFLLLKSFGPCGFVPSPSPHRPVIPLCLAFPWSRWWRWFVRVTTVKTYLLALRTQNSGNASPFPWDA